MKRKDGTLLRNVDPMYTIIPYIMKERNDALNMTTVWLEEEPMQEYLNRKRKEGVYISHMALILAAFVRVVDEYPEINRFIVNSRIYARNELTLTMVVLRNGDADGTIAKVFFQPEDNLFDVNKRLNDMIAKEKEPTAENGTDQYMRNLTRNSFIARLSVGFLMWMDKHGMLPKSMIDDFPFHATMCLTNLASIRSGSIYHHIYNFGTISNFAALGLVEKKVEEQRDGSFKTVRYVPLGITMDERVASGHTYAAAFRRMKYYLNHPEMLEEKPEIIHTDPGIEKKKK